MEENNKETPQGRKGISNVVKKLEASVQEGNLYEAQQMYKTLYFRYMTGNKYDEAKQLLISGCMTMLSLAHHNEGTELGLLLLKVYKESQTKFTQESLEKILNIISLHVKDNSDLNETFIKAAITWSIEFGEFKEGAPEIHNMLTTHYNNEHDYGKAQKHFIRGNQPEQFSRVLVTWAKSVYPSERDLIIARVVFQYLCLANLKDANIVFENFLKQQPSFPETPLINFLRFLLITLQRDAYPLFEKLRQKYRPSIDRDPSFQQYLNHIALVFFKVRPSGGMNSFGDLIKSMLG